MIGTEVRLTPAGGMSEVGARNGMIIQYGENAVVIDWGQKIPLRSPGDVAEVLDAQSRDLLDEYYPDGTLLDGLRVQALCVTHGHQDHSEGARRVYSRFPNARIITDPFTELVMEMRSGKARRTGFPSERFVTHATRLKIGDFIIERFLVNHSIPGSCGFLIEVGGRRIVHLGDFKSWPVRAGLDKNREVFGALRSQGDIDVALMDATNAEEQGYVISEDVVGMAIENILAKENGRVFFAAISSNVRRFESIAQCAMRQGRPVYVGGRSLQDFFHLAKFPFAWRDIMTEHGQLNPDPSTWPNNAVICVTGSQGEQGSFLERLVQWPDHRGLVGNDALVITQDTIPLPVIQEQFAKMAHGASGMFRRMYLPEDTPEIATKGADIIRVPHVHASGHAMQGDMKRVFEILEPRLLVPCHADRPKRQKLADLVGQWGGEAKLVDDGETLVL